MLGFVCVCVCLYDVFINLYLGVVGEIKHTKLNHQTYARKSCRLHVNPCTGPQTERETELGFFIEFYIKCKKINSVWFSQTEKRRTWARNTSPLEDAGKIFAPGLGIIHFKWIRRV